MQAVDELLARARDGHGGALALLSEPGMGRSALLAEAARRAAEAGMRVAGVRGIRPELRLDGAGLNRLVRPIAEHADPRHAGTVRDLLDGRTAPPLELCAAVHGTVAAYAADGPLLLWVDDAHWLDRVSLDALAFLARRLDDLSVAMLFAAHNEHVTTPERDRLAEIPKLALPALDDAAARAVLAGRIPGDPPDDLVAALVELAAGNPRGLVELAEGLTPGQLAGEEPPPESLPPDSGLRAIYRRRLYRLSADARCLLLMAVADERLDADTLARAAHAGGLDLGELESARAWGLVRVDGAAITVPSPLIRTSLYADAPLAERRAAHELLTRVLDPRRHRLRRAEHSAALAGEPDAAIAEELCAAAEEARAVGDFATASRAWRRAAELTPIGPAGPEPATRPAGTEPGPPLDMGSRSARMLAAAGDAWLAGQGRRARALLRDLPYDRSLRADVTALRGEIELRDGTPNLAGRILTDAAEQLLPADRERALEMFAYAGEAYCVGGDLASYVRLADRVARLREPAEKPATELLFAHFTGMSASYTGMHDRAVGPLRRVAELGAAADGCAAKVWAALAALFAGEDRRAHELATAAVDRATGRDAAVLPWALVFLAQAQFWLGRYPQAVATSETGLRAARAAGQGNVATDHVAMLALLAAFQGDKETAVRHLDEVVDAAATRGLDRAGAFTAWAVACLELAEDRPADAAVRLRLMRGTGHVHPVVRVMATPYLIEAAVRCGRPGSAVGAFGVFESWATSTRSPARLALVARCRALLADDPEAEEFFREALRLHRDGGASDGATSAFELARTELLYGHWLRRGRRPSAARDHLRGALQIFQQYDAEVWADRAREELRAAGDTVTADAPRTFGALTAQQAKIAQMVADGATNREIAARLQLSHRTVDHHLRNIFVRLGIRSRVELTRFVR